MSYISINATGLTNPLQEILMADNVQAGDSISYELCKLLWEYHPLAGKIIEKPVRLALSKERTITIDSAIEEEVVKAFKSEWNNLGVTNHIRDVMFLSRVYGAASIVYGAPDIPTDQPIDPWVLAELPNLYFNQLDPLNLAGSIVTNQNPNSPDFQKPLPFPTAAGQPYHPSRACTIFCGTPIYLSFQSSSFSFSGRSLFLRALYPLKSFIQTMTVDDLVSLKAGVVIAKIQQPGSVLTNLMSKAAGIKRQLLQEAQTGNVLSIQPDEEISSIDLNNTDKAMTVARDNIIANIAAATDVPALMLKDEAFTKGFGEGTEDTKAVVQYIDGLRQDMDPLFRYFDKIVMHRAWNKSFYEGMVAKYPEAFEGKNYNAFFYELTESFQADWPSLMEEPASERVKTDEVKLRGITEILRTFLPVIDPENRARMLKWAEDNLNQMPDTFQSELMLDMEAIANYEPPTPMAEPKEPPSRS